MITSEPTAFGDIAAGLMARALTLGADRAPRDPGRADVQREPLSRVVRLAVLTRDEFTCRWCYASARRHHGLPLEADHIVPWSAGGADHPVNLRTLCGPCNQGRSNRISGLEERALPIGSACQRCFPQAVTDDVPSVHAYCLACRDVGAMPYLTALLVGGNVPAAGIPALREHDEDYTGFTGHTAAAGHVLDQLRQRAVAQTVACPSCDVRPGEPCVGYSGYPLVRSAAHLSRLAAAAEVSS